MSLIISDRVVETTTTTGTGAITLAGAVTGYRAFSSKMSVGDTCFYTIEAIDGSGNPTGEWETGFGTYSATNTLTRTTVKDSSNSGSAVTFSTGTKRVFLNLIASAAAREAPSWRLGSVPLSTAMTAVSGDGTNATVSDDANVGLLIDGGTPVSGNKMRGLEQTIPNANADWTFTARVNIFMPDTSFTSVGVWVRDTTGGKLLMFSYGQARTLKIDRATLAAFTSTPITYTPAGSPLPQWLQIKWDNTGSIFTFNASLDGKLWASWGTETLAAFITSKATAVGIGVSYNRTTAPHAIVSCDYFTLTQP
jgi:hypothetical protein